MDDPNPPIHRLNSDLLSYIFEMNADMFADEDALQTTWFTSQVCGNWRELMLNTPSLWAKLIDLDYLHESREPWRKELVRRSGTESLLWIRGEGYAFLNLKGCGSLLDFFLDLLRDHWERIQRLVVQFKINLIPPKVPTCWAPLYLPARHLEVFCLPFWNSMFPSGHGMLPPISLFAGDAPMLREFRSKGITVDPKSPWLHRLLIMDLGAVEMVRETLEILKEAPNLEYLQLDTIRDGSLASPLPVVPLPKLGHLIFQRVDAQQGAILLDHLQLPPQCSLRYSPHHMWDRGALSEDNIRPVARILSKFARRYFKCHTSTNISLEYLATTFTFADKTSSSECPPEFYISFTSDFDFPLHAAAMFLHDLSIPEFSTVTKLEFLASNLPESSFVSFLGCMPSLKTINTNERGIQCLISFLNEQRTAVGSPKILIPSLKVLKLSYFEPGGFRGGIFQFIMSRIHDGYPIAVLDLTAYCPHVRPSLGFLEEANGLTVRWWQRGVISEYVCGSGHPEKLPYFE